MHPTCYFTGEQKRISTWHDAQVQALYTSSNGYDNGRAVVHNFDVSPLCQLHIQEKLQDLAAVLHG